MRISGWSSDVCSSDLSFSNKFLAAYAFGIITDVIKSNIDTVRHIRNAFAHTMAPLTFSHAAIVTSLEKSPLPNGKRTQLYKRLSSVREIAPERDRKSTRLKSRH